MEIINRRIGITGGNGFIGWHLRCYLHSLGFKDNILIADRETFNNIKLLDNFVSSVDVIYHLAAVNRSSHDKELEDGNLKPATDLCKALESNNATPLIIYTNTTHSENKNSIYGVAKAGVAKIFNEWANKNQGAFVNVTVPHVFGEHGKPFYNSAIATFCHQIVRGEELTITGNGQLELLHVQDLAEVLVEFGERNKTDSTRLEGVSISVLDVANKLKLMFDTYSKGIWPDLSNKFEKDLFNTLRGAIENKDRQIYPQLHSDDRGWLVETIKAGSGGQCFVSTTHPKITRGNHYHRRKVERFFILRGKASITIRKLLSDESYSYEIGDDGPSFVDIPTLHTHNITNVGAEELITLFWTNEFYNPNSPDTFFEEV